MAPYSIFQPKIIHAWEESDQHEPLKPAQQVAVLSVNQPPAYPWGHGIGKYLADIFRNAKGYKEARELIADGRPERIKEMLEMGLNILDLIFKDLDDPCSNPDRKFVELTLSEDLLQWRSDRHNDGFILPSKGNGLTLTSSEVIQLLNIENWPLPLQVNGALFGSGFANMLIGAPDAEILYSNYCNDMGFFYEHGYHKVFPEYESLLNQAANDTHALKMLGGRERRIATEIGLQYIRGKIALEESHKEKLTNKTARLNRWEAQILFFCESSILGMAAEAMARGFDKAGVMNDFVFGSPGSDVLDVGSDINNSELLNSFLCTADITDSMVVTEEALRRVYDAYAHSSARIFTERWSEPGARMCSTLYTWHIQNNRHEFLRRAVLGYCKARKVPTEQRMADFCEAFDKELHTTAFSRPLKGACNGGDPCDHVKSRLEQWGTDLLAELWWLLSTGPVQYASKGVVSDSQEKELAERLRVTMAKAYSLGLVDEMAWLMAHASHHAWQVNYLFEGAMFGSLLDNGKLKGKLDRKE